MTLLLNKINICKDEHDRLLKDNSEDKVNWTNFRKSA